jgi:hypothetical protein
LSRGTSYFARPSSRDALRNLNRGADRYLPARQTYTRPAETSFPTIICAPTPNDSAGRTIASSRQCAFFETKKAPKRQKEAAGKNLWARIGRPRRRHETTQNIDTTNHRVPRPPTLRRRDDETIVPSRRVRRSYAVRPAKPPSLYGPSLKLGWSSTGVHRTRDGDYRVEPASRVPLDSQKLAQR